MAVIVTKKRNRFNQVVDLGEVKVKFDDEGKAEVEDEIAKSLYGTKGILNEDGSDPENKGIRLKALTGQEMKEERARLDIEWKRIDQEKERIANEWAEIKIAREELGSDVSSVDTGDEQPLTKEELMKGNRDDLVESFLDLNSVTDPEFEVPTSWTKSVLADKIIELTEKSDDEAGE